MTTTIIFIAILAVLIFVHELGHFLIAKLFKIRVDAFALGFPPTLWKKKVGETEYKLNAVPFGGYVSIYGENPQAEEDEVASGAVPDTSRSFAHKNRAIQAAVLVAGITFNILFAWVLLSLGYAIGLPASVEGTRYPEQVVDAVLTVTTVKPESPAQGAGILSGDKILFVGTPTEGVEMPTQQEVSNFIATHGENELTLLIMRENVRQAVLVTPALGIIADAPAIGIGMDTIGTLRLSVWQSALEGARFTAVMVRETAVGTFGFLKDAFTGKARFADVSGPVGIAGLVGEAKDLGWGYLITFTAFISVNLAVLNLLPIPALDGGRLLFVAIEAVTRRSIPFKIAGIVNMIGFALLLLLMVVVTYRDIVKLFI